MIKQQYETYSRYRSNIFWLIGIASNYGWIWWMCALSSAVRIFIPRLNMTIGDAVSLSVLEGQLVLTWLTFPQLLHGWELQAYGGEINVNADHAVLSEIARVMKADRYRVLS